MRRRHTFAHRLAPHAGTTERLLANRLGHTLEPAFGFKGQVTVWNRRHPGRLTLRGFEPDLYRVKPEWVSLPADGKRSFQGLKTFFEGKHWRVRLYIARPLSLSISGVSAQASRATNGSRRCRSASLALSFNCIAKRQMGREKHSGIFSTLRMGRYSKPAATSAASLIQVPPSLPGNRWEPSLSVQFRM